VDNPIEIVLVNPKPRQVEIPLHPYNDELGKRIVKANDTLYLSGTDKELLKINEILRMKDLYNIKILKQIDENKYEAEICGDELLPKIPRLQWVSEPIKIEIVKPEMLYLNNRINKDSLEYITGFGEKNISHLEIGEIVQLERFGYTKVNKKNDKIEMNYIHG